MSDLTKEANKHIKELLKAHDNFRDSFSGYWLGKINAEIKWLHSYIEEIENEESEQKQFKLKL